MNNIPTNEELSSSGLDGIDKVIAVYLDGLHNPSEDGLYNVLRAERDTEALKQAVKALIHTTVAKEKKKLLEELLSHSELLPSMTYYDGDMKMVVRAVPVSSIQQKLEGEL